MPGCPCSTEDYALFTTSEIILVVRKTRGTAYVLHPTKFSMQITDNYLHPDPQYTGILFLKIQRIKYNTIWSIENHYIHKSYNRKWQLFHIHFLCLFVLCLNCKWITFSTRLHPGHRKRKSVSRVFLLWLLIISWNLFPGITAF